MEWYRNADWCGEISADFERRLARSRHQKAQNLSLQGYHLIEKHPDVARDLLQRAVALADDFETPRALSNLAKAQLALRDVDGALESIEQALEWKIERPNNVAVHPGDYVSLVGMFARADRLPAAEVIADALLDDGLFGPDPQIFAAKALVFALAGRAADAAHYAKLALPHFAQMPDAFALGIDIADARQRLETLADG